MTAYLYTRALSAPTGRFVFPATGTAFTASESPALEIVIRTLRTPLGLCAANPSFGTDWSRVQKMAPNAASTARSVIQDALAGAVRRGVLSGLEVSATVPRPGVILWSVEFTDPRLARNAGRQRHTGGVP